MWEDIDSFVWDLIHPYCSIETFSQFLFICKNSNLCILQKEEFYEKRLFDIFKFNITLDSKADHEWCLARSPIQSIKISYLIAKFKINPVKEKLDYDDDDEILIYLAPRIGKAGKRPKYNRVCMSIYLNFDYDGNLMSCRVSFVSWSFDEDFNPFNIVYLYNFKENTFHTVMVFCRNPCCEEDCSVTFQTEAFWSSELSGWDREVLMQKCIDIETDRRMRIEEHCICTDESLDEIMGKKKIELDVNERVDTWNAMIGYHIIDKIKDSTNEDDFHGNSSTWADHPDTMRIIEEEHQVVFGEKAHAHVLVKWLGLDEFDVFQLKVDPRDNPEKPKLLPRCTKKFVKGLRDKYRFEHREIEPIVPRAGWIVSDEIMQTKDEKTIQDQEYVFVPVGPL